MRMLKRKGGPRAVALATWPVLLLHGPLLRTFAMLEFRFLLTFLPLREPPPPQVQIIPHDLRWRLRWATTATRFSAT